MWKGGVECGREELSVEGGKMKGERESHIPELCSTSDTVV